jgi:thymidylate synthase
MSCARSCDGAEATRVNMSNQAQLAAEIQHSIDLKPTRGVLQPNTCHVTTHGHEQQPVTDRESDEHPDHTECLQCKNLCSKQTAVPS